MSRATYRQILEMKRGTRQLACRVVTVRRFLLQLALSFFR